MLTSDDSGIVSDVKTVTIYGLYRVHVVSIDISFGGPTWVNVAKPFCAITDEIT